MKKTLFFLLLALFAIPVGAQDLAHFKRVVKELSSSKYSPGVKGTYNLYHIDTANFK